MAGAMLVLMGFARLGTPGFITILQQARGGRRKIIASATINMKDYASDVPTQHTMTITLKPATKKIVKASIQLTLSCVFLREGKAT